jgi:molecular chaperone IbpA
MPKIPTYPPYNIKKVDENKYVIEMAVAGFGKQDLELELQDGTLTIKGNVSSEDADYIYKGIAERAFTRQFTLADTVEVKNADLINGMLKIWLERFIPEEKKPKKISIGDTETAHNGEPTKQFLSEKYGDK